MYTGQHQHSKLKERGTDEINVMKYDIHTSWKDTHEYPFDGIATLMYDECTMSPFSSIPFHTITELFSNINKWVH